MLPVKATLYFTVTNNLRYDQRMIRICTTLATAGYKVVLVGRKTADSQALAPMPYTQKLLSCFFTKGAMFYAEYNLRLFFFLLFKKMDLVCAADLDTILPCYFISRLKAVKRVYDAHELFCEMKEVVTRPAVYSIWKAIERYAVRRYKNGYTVSLSIADYFKAQYGVEYTVFANTPLLQATSPAIIKTEKIILYQGAVNEARGLEYLIPAMNDIDAVLHIYGTGNFITKTHALIAANKLEQKVTVHGMVPPEKLPGITASAFIGVNLVENTGLNQYYSLANKFFDYIHAEVPQVTMQYPEYENINNRYKVALLIDELNTSTVVNTINKLVNDAALYKQLQENCVTAKQQLNWQLQTDALLQFYHNLIG
jgi:glycosyltransferase involved in cell wall biosynthesis